MSIKIFIYEYSHKFIQHRQKSETNPSASPPKKIGKWIFK